MDSLVREQQASQLVGIQVAAQGCGLQNTQILQA